MSSFNTAALVKLMLMGLLSFALLLSVSSLYTGPRYGKRLPFAFAIGSGFHPPPIFPSQYKIDTIDKTQVDTQDTDSSRVSLRSSSPRTIQSRSQVRFYAGSRYGGKRSYWETSMPESETAEYLRQQQQPLQKWQQAQGRSPSPYDCFYIPYVGVRCVSIRRLQNSVWNTSGESDEDSGSPIVSSSNFMNGGPSSSVGDGADAS